MTKIQVASGTAGKETIYVDVDDEITAIIDKVSSAKGKIVALVLPKRCPVLQSVVNMKLLKRTADNAKKNLVLVTTESGLMPLAASVGLYVASSPSSKPAIPELAGSTDGDSAEDLDEPLKVVDGTAPDQDDAFDSKASARKSIGELAAGAATGADATEAIDMAAGDDADAPLTAAAAKKTKLKKDKKLHVPNFDSFRKKLAFGILGLIILGVGLYFALMVLPSATITIATDSSTITTNMNLNLDTAATKLDVTSNTVPATAQSQQKTTSQTVQATGQQNNGQKASGQVTLQLKDCNTSTVSIPAGSGLSSGGLTYITQGDVTLNSVTVGHQCNPSSLQSLYTATVSVTALKGGANYNTANNSTFTVPSSVSGASDVNGSGSASGGTDDITTIVQQSDISSATSKIASADTSAIKQQLQTNLESKGLEPIVASFLAGTPQVTSNAQAGDKTSNVTVTAVTTYTMLGVKKSDLQTLVHNNVDGKLDKGKQVVLDDGVANAQFSENNPGTITTATVAMSVKSQAGPELNADSLKTQLAGMKSGDVKNYLNQTPGVTDVQVKFSPFWVNAVPKKAAKVTINIEKAGN